MGEIRFVGTGETRGYPYMVCKKIPYQQQYSILPVYTSHSISNKTALGINNQTGGKDLRWSDLGKVIVMSSLVSRSLQPMPVNKNKSQ